MANSRSYSSDIEMIREIIMDESREDRLLFINDDGEFATAAQTEEHHVMIVPMPLDTPIRDQEYEADYLVKVLLNTTPANLRSRRKDG